MAATTPTVSWPGIRGNYTTVNKQNQNEHDDDQQALIYLCNEFAFVDVQIGTANTASLDLDLHEGLISSWPQGNRSKSAEVSYQNVILTKLRHGNLDNLVLLGL